MRKTPLKRGTKQMKRTGFAAKTPVKGHTKPRKRRTKTPLQKAKDKLWDECKRITRLRYVKHDGSWDCFSCGKNIDEPGKAQTGHYIPSSTCSTEMRYDLDNLRVQCYNCNINKSGNWVEYEKHLNIEKGLGFTDSLKARNETTKGLSYRIDWYEMYIKNYREII
jgi:DNA-directed RNA polymerase subunit N (RpoN/RPB10)